MNIKLEVSLERILLDMYKDLYVYKDSGKQEFCEKLISCMSDLGVLFSIQGKSFHFTPKTPMDDFLSNFRNLVYSKIPPTRIHCMYIDMSNIHTKRVFNFIFPERDEFDTIFTNNCETFFIWHNKFDINAYTLNKISPTNLKFVDIGISMYTDTYIARYNNPHKDTFKMKKKIFYEREDYFINKPATKYSVI